MPRLLVMSSSGITPALEKTVLWRSDVERAFAPDAQSAYDTARLFRPALVLVDGADAAAAIGFIRRLRGNDATRSSAIAVLSRRDLEDEESFRRAGANVVLPEPVDPEHWDARIEALLNVPRRRAERVPVRIVVWSARRGDADPVDGTTINISVRGTLLETTGKLSVGAKLDLSFRLPGDSLPVAAVGHVVRDAGEAEGRHRSGVEFVVLRGDARARIRRFVESLEAEMEPAAPEAEAGLADSERSEWEQQLRDAERRKAAIVESNPDGLITLDGEGRILELNPAAAAAFGICSADVLGHRAPETSLPAPVKDWFRQNLTRPASETSVSPDGQRVEVSTRRGDGRETWLELTAVPVRLGRRVLVTVHVRDITDRKLAEEALRTRERLFHALFQNATDALCVVDGGGTIQEVNTAACALVGLERPALVGRPLSRFLDPGSMGEGPWGSAGGDTPTRLEVSLVRADSARRRVELTLTADILPGRHLAALRDVTEQERIEEQVRQAQKMEAVGRLAGGIAHDFNNLLTAVTGFAEMLVASLPPDGAERHRAAEILKAADRGAGLVRQLLAFSRRQVTKPRVLDLNGVIRETDAMLRQILGEHVMLDLELAAHSCTTIADASQVEQVLVNLVVNARDAMPGGGTITVSTGRAVLDDEFVRRHVGARPGAFVTLSVTDTGEGMAPETRDRVFEPFFTTKVQGKGTGLGLATVYGIVKQNDGYIWVDSAPGHGTRFDVYLPRSERLESASPAAGGETDVTPLSGTVLLAEDDPIVREMARDVLEDAGLRVLEAADGARALDAASLHDGPIDLLLTDLIMPGLGGRELAERLAEVRPTTRVLYTSGYLDEQMAPGGVLPPDTPLLQKPFTRDGLLARIRRVLRGETEG
jgi:two-component system, cell cycle sensor histidine kinase and response regulator CckA